MEFLLFFNYLVFVVLHQIQHINFTALSILFIINTVVLVLFFLKKNNQYESSLKKNNPNQTVVSSKSYSSEDIENQLINEIEDYILFINSFKAKTYSP